MPDAADAACDDPACGRRGEMFASMRRALGAAHTASCPPDVDELGRATWTLVHAVAARYPVRGDHGRGRRCDRRRRARSDARTRARARREWRMNGWTDGGSTATQDAPTATQKIQARRFFDALGDLYPCERCRVDFRADIDAHPPALASRAALSRWACERHNEVNRKLGKPEMSCALKDLDERWRKATTHARACAFDAPRD